MAKPTLSYTGGGARSQRRSRFGQLAVAMGLTLVVALAADNTARAAFMTFFGEDLNGSSTVRLTSHPNASAAQAAFLSNLSGASTEDFEGFAPNTPGPLTLNFSGVGTAVLSAITPPQPIVRSIPSPFTDGNGRYPVSGDKYLETHTSLNMVFQSPVAALGFFGVDFGDFQGQITLTLVSGGTKTINIPHSQNPSLANGAVLYFGVIDTTDPFVQVQFGVTQTGQVDDFFALDGLTAATPSQVVLAGAIVPVPPTFALAAVGMLSLFGYRWRKRSTKADLSTGSERTV